MLPMSIQCSACGDYMFQGTKCNSRKELCYDEFYLGINVYRIYLHCKSCYAEITIKTDPKNCDYIVEKGATRHFEPWGEHQREQAMEMKRKFAGSAIEEAEERAINTQRDMDQKRELGRLSAIGMKQERVNISDVSELVASGEPILTETDNARIAMFTELQRSRTQHKPTTHQQSLPVVSLNWKPSTPKTGLLAFDSDDD